MLSPLTSLRLFVWRRYSQDGALTGDQVRLEFHLLVLGRQQTVFSVASTVVLHKRQFCRSRRWLGVRVDKNLSNLKTPGGILEFALEQKRETHRLYGELLNDSGTEILRDVVTQLKDEELRHVHFIERKIADLNLGRLR